MEIINCFKFKPRNVGVVVEFLNNKNNIQDNLKSAEKRRDHFNNSSTSLVRTRFLKFVSSKSFLFVNLQRFKVDKFSLNLLNRVRVRRQVDGSFEEGRIVELSCDGSPVTWMNKGKFELITDSGLLLQFYDYTITLQVTFHCRRLL